MTHAQIEKRLHRNCKREVTNIKNARNFLEVESAICDAFADIFSLRNAAIQRIIARGEVWEARVNQVLSLRQISLNNHKEEIRAALLQLAPDRIKNTYMFKHYTLTHQNK